MENNCSHNPGNVPAGTETDYEIIISATFMSILQKSMQEKKISCIHRDVGGGGESGGVE